MSSFGGRARAGKGSFLRIGLCGGGDMWGWNRSESLAR